MLRFALYKNYYSLLLLLLTRPVDCARLLALNKEDDRQKFSILLKKAVLVLTPNQKKNLPSPIKEKVLRRIELVEEKKAL